MDSLKQQVRKKLSISLDKSFLPNVVFADIVLPPQRKCGQSYVDIYFPLPLI